MQLRIDYFTGRKHKLAKHLLDNQEASYASNIDLEMFDTRGMKYPKKIQDISETDIKTIYRHGGNWCISDHILHFVPSFLSNDSFERVYYTGYSQARFIPNDILSDPFDFASDYRLLGVPAPESAISSASGYTSGSDYRAYFYTYVNRYGEEGPPSPLLEIIDYGSGDVTLTGFSEPPTNRGLTNDINGNRPEIRIYRTNATGTGLAAFQYVGSFYVTDVSDWATHSFTDNVSDSGLGEVCPSVTWDPPPDNLQGLVSLPTGYLAGFVGNTVYFSEQFLPHAWPSDYYITFEYDIVGLAVYSSYLIVLTEGYPFLVYGDSPLEMKKVKVDGFYPCSHILSIVASKEGIYYASPFGIVLINTNGARLLTENIFTKDQWSNYLNDFVHANIYDNKYIFFYRSSDRVEKGGLILDLLNGYYTLLDWYCEATFLMEDTARFYVVKETYDGSGIYAIYQWAGDDYNYLEYTWRSKTFILPDTVNFSCCKLIINSTFYNDYLSNLEESNYIENYNESLFSTGEIGGEINEETINELTINGDDLLSPLELSMNENIRIKIYADDDLFYERICSASQGNLMFKLPSTKKARKWEIEVQGYIPIASIILATSPKEL